MNVLVLGAAGLLGQHVMQNLTSRYVATPASRQRRGPAWEQVDLTDRATFYRLQRYDAVINAADSACVSSRAAIEHCLRHGVLFLEAAHDARRIAELLSLRQNASHTQGAAVIGLGLFPGVTNLLAREALTMIPTADRLEIFVQVGVISGAGDGMCRHMVDHLIRPPLFYEQGVLCPGEPMQSGPSLSDDCPARTFVLASLPEPLLLHASTGVKDIVAALCLRPSWLCWTLRPAAKLLRRWPQLSAPAQAALVAVRGRLLRSLPTRLDLTVVARKQSAPRESVQISATCRDGVASTAAVITATLECLRSRERLPAGLFTIDELCTLPRVISQMDQHVPSVDVERISFR